MPHCEAYNREAATLIEVLKWPLVSCSSCSSDPFSWLQQLFFSSKSSPHFLQALGVAKTIFCVGRMRSLCSSSKATDVGSRIESQWNADWQSPRHVTLCIIKVNQTFTYYLKKCVLILYFLSKHFWTGLRFTDSPRNASHQLEIKKCKSEICC